MFEFVSQNLSTIIISAVVFAVIILDIVYLVRRKKQGKNICECSGCNGNCSGCSGQCGKNSGH